MKKFIIPALGLAVAAAGFATPASARRDVMIMLQEMPMNGPHPASSYPVTVEVQMNAATMAEMQSYLHDGSMVLVCKQGGPTIMMCHGK